jgi:hypothetical protein
VRDLRRIPSNALGGAVGDGRVGVLGRHRTNLLSRLRATSCDYPPVGRDIALPAPVSETRRAGGGIEQLP